MMRCLNPSHSDTNASMKLLTDLNKEQVWCYGCHATGDIFTVNHWIKKTPMHGLEFIKDNVFALAKQFDIPHDDVELSPEQVERLEQFRFNTIVAEKLVLRDENKVLVNATFNNCFMRGWDERTCEKLGVSTILDYNRLLRDIQHVTGMTTDEIKARGVIPTIFGPDFITIRLDDERGKCVGFTARNLKWTKDSDLKKYNNSSHSAVFQKGKILYGMNHVRKNKHRRLDIFEGNGSFITAYGAGHSTCVALCGSSFTDDQVQLIVDMGFSHINLVLDSDATGRAKTDEFMQKLSGMEGLRVECTALKFKAKDKDLKDPDDFIQAYGLPAFFKLKPTGAFEWYLEKEGEEVKAGKISAVDFANKMVKVIFNTANRIERSRQRGKLSEITGIPERDLEAEIERLARISISDVKTHALKKISGARSAEDVSSALEDLRSSVENSLEVKSISANLSIQESVTSFDEFMTVLENKKPGLQGWTTGYPILDTNLSGIPKPMGFDADGNSIKIPGTILGFPGVPQHGKSTILQNIVCNMARKNNDITALYWCLDDSRQRVTERMLAMMSGVSWKKITRRIPINSAEIKQVNQCKDELRQMMLEGKLVFKDHSNGSSMPTLFRWVEMMQEEFDRPVCAIIDSFHKIHAAAGDGAMDNFARTRSFSEKIKAYAQTNHVTFMASLEMTKGQHRGVEPELLNMSDSRKLEYDFDIVSTVYNHFYDMDGDSDQIIRRGNEILPLIKLNIRKSKDGGSGPVYFALDQTNFRLTDYSIDDINGLTNLKPVTPKKLHGITITPPDLGGLTAVEPWHS